VTLLVAFAAVVVGAVFVVAHYFVGTVPTVDYSSAASGGVVNVVLQEDPQNNTSSTPDWVSYYVMKPGADPMQQSSWVHTTLFTIPANTRVNVTIYGYDGCTPLRNNYWSQIQGTQGGTVTVQQFKGPGQPLGSPATTSVINSWAHCAVAHTFAVPSFHLYVPVGSPSATNNGVSAGLCSNSPCVSGPYTLETFSFMSPSQTGHFRWQCLIPCGGGYLDGNGGPMATTGFMAGQINVVSR
jgi:hypothetical protein